jgi:hypothetical protein
MFRTHIRNRLRKCRRRAFVVDLWQENDIYIYVYMYIYK